MFDENKNEEKIHIREMNEKGYMEMFDENKNEEKIHIREIEEEGYMEMFDENKNEEKIYIREIEEEGYMEMFDENKNEEKIHIREIEEEGYMEMFDENKNEENIHIREMNEEGYMEMFDENKNEENIHIREMNEEGYMENDNEEGYMDNEENIYIREMNEEGYMDNEEMEREFDNDEMENEMRNEMEMYNEEEYMEMRNENGIGNKILRNTKLERKFYEDEKLIYEINNIYRKYGLKINNKNVITKKKLQEIIYDMIRFNFDNEKNENLFKNELKEELVKLKIRNNENIEKICENLSKNEFRIIKKYKYKKNLAKFIRRMYREYKWLRTNNFKFLITENFKKIEEIEMIKLNRNGLVLCYNGANKIVCIYLFYLVDNYLNDITDSFVPYVYNNHERIELYGVLFEKSYLDNRFKDKRIIEEKII